jgi:O-antigen ligase
LVRDSIGRSNESSDQRQQLVSEGMRLYFQGDAIGVGPGRTKATFAAESAPYVKEAHDDYVATLVERGYLGGLGLAVLIVSIAVRFGRVRWRSLSPEVREIVPYPALLLGLGCTFLVSAFFYEVLHFRHLWALLGLAAGLDDTPPPGGG